MRNAHTSAAAAGADTRGCTAPLRAVCDVPAAARCSSSDAATSTLVQHKPRQPGKRSVVGLLCVHAEAHQHHNTQRSPPQHINICAARERQLTPRHKQAGEPRAWTPRPAQRATCGGGPLHALGSPAWCIARSRKRNNADTTTARQQASGPCASTPCAGCASARALTQTAHQPGTPHPLARTQQQTAGWPAKLGMPSNASQHTISTAQARAQAKPTSRAAPCAP